MDTVHVRPVEPEIMLLDDQPVRNENGVIIEDRLDMCATAGSDRAIPSSSRDPTPDGASCSTGRPTAS